MNNLDIRYIVIDVDGTLTDSGIYYDESGNEIKKFCTRDAAAFFAAKAMGIKTVILTGRECKATNRRLKELEVDFLFQGIKDKYVFIKGFMEKNDISKYQIAYIGDDLNDLSSMRLAGFVGCPKDACEEVKQVSDYVSKVCGGKGAVRDIIEQIFRMHNIWEEAISKAYNIGI